MTREQILLLNRAVRALRGTSRQGYSYIDGVARFDIANLLVELEREIKALQKQLEEKTALYDEVVADALQFERERDAAVKDMQMIVKTDNCKCETCGHCAFDEEDESRICANCDVETYSNWNWRGAPVED